MFGFLNINKPTGWTSRDVVNRVQKLCPRGTKLGHAGTLDPMATGVLVVCVGPATRLVQYIHQLPKTYRSTFLLGRRSSTDDTDGVIEVLSNAPPVTEQQLKEHLPAFLGTIEQIPPQVSAVKVAGERAYKVARRGEAVEIRPRPVTVHRLELVAFDAPEFSLEIECGSGTYIRAIGRDLAAKLGTAAVMSSLVRTSIGPFKVEEAVDIESLAAETIVGRLHPPLFGLPQLPRIDVNEEIAARLRSGQRIAASRLCGKTAEGEAAVICNTKLVCIAEFEQGQLRPRLVFKSA